MNNRFQILAIAALALAFVLCSRASTVIYQNDFEKEDVDQAPASFLVLDGDFAVKQVETNKVLELPGAPLDSFGALFGPTTNGNLTVSARVFGTGKGRRFPTFAIGLAGGTGFKLRVAPAKDALEIYLGDAVLATAPFKWKSSAWTDLLLHVAASSDGTWRIEGKAWTEGSPRPADWTVSTEQKFAPPAGRASLWGSPFSGQPIRYDDLVLTVD